MQRNRIDSGPPETATLTGPYDDFNFTAFREFRGSLYFFLSAEGAKCETLGQRPRTGCTSQHKRQGARCDESVSAFGAEAGLAEDAPNELVNETYLWFRGLATTPISNLQSAIINRTHLRAPLHYMGAIPHAISLKPSKASNLDDGHRVAIVSSKGDIYTHEKF